MPKTILVQQAVTRSPGFHPFKKTKIISLSEIDYCLNFNFVFSCIIPTSLTNLRPVQFLTCRRIRQLLFRATKTSLWFFHWQQNKKIRWWRATGWIPKELHTFSLHPTLPADHHCMQRTIQHLVTRANKTGIGFFQRKQTKTSAKGARQAGFLENATSARCSLPFLEITAACQR